MKSQVNQIIKNYYIIFKNGTHAALLQSQHGLKKEAEQRFTNFNGLINQHSLTFRRVQHA